MSDEEMASHGSIHLAEQIVTAPEQPSGQSSAPSPASSSKSLSPLAYTNWVRSAQRKLLTAAAKGQSPTQDQISGLSDALAGKHDALVLSDTDWKVWCALGLWQISSPSAGATIPDVNSLRSIIQLHEAATRSNGGSALVLSSFITYVQLLTQLHYVFEGIEQPPAPFWEEDEEEDGGRWKVDDGSEDLLASWTGLSGGPKFLRLRHQTGKLSLRVGYGNTSRPQIPTRVQARAAGIEEEWDHLLGTEAVRSSIREANSRAAGETNWSHLLWNPWRDFEMVHLLQDKSAARVEAIKQMYLARLRVPHRQHEETAQAFSSFVSQYLSADAYERTMTSLQKSYGSAKEAWASIEQHEDAIQATFPSSTDAEDESHWRAWSSYLQTASRQRNSDLELVSAAFERCIAFLGLPPALSSLEEELHPPEPSWESDLKNSRLKIQREERHAVERAARDAKRHKCQRREGVFLDYLTYLTTAKAPASQLLDVAERAVRTLPMSGALWATYLRQLARLHRSKAHIDQTFARAVEGEQCGQDDLERGKDHVEAPNGGQMVELLVGRIDAERELAATALAAERGLERPEALIQLPTDENRFMEIFALISYALSLPQDQKRPAASHDKSMRLQRLASSWAEAGGPGMSSLAESIWDTALGHQPTNGRVWIEVGNFHARTGDARKARSIFRQGASRANLTERSELLEAWRRVESVFGSAEDLVRIDERIRRETEKQWEQWAQYAQTQQQYERYAAFDTTGAAGAATGSMDVDGVAAANSVINSPSAQKRKGEADAVNEQARVRSAPEASESDSKRGRQEDNQPARDRENSSILVAGLPIDATMIDLQALFEDCGPIREIGGPTVVGKDETLDSAAGVVEFMDRSSIPAARTKEKKKIRGCEIAVSLGWECTLYVTNFPPNYDDRAIRNVFANYGTIYNVRWPSKRYDQSRRFCYVQYTSPREAQEAMAALHQHSLAPGTSLQVHLSDPSRRKQRTDANADERELYVSSIARGCSPEQLRAHFEALGDVQGFRMPTGPDGKPKGIAFVDYRTPIEAQRAMVELNGSLIAGKAIRVQMADTPKVHTVRGPRAGSSTSAASPPPPGPDRVSSINSQHRENPSASANRMPGFTARSVKVRGLPSDAQEPLIQQLFERAAGGVGKVRKVEWTPSAPGEETGKPASAIVEFDDAATAGKVTLMSGQLSYVGDGGSAASDHHILTVLPLERGGAADVTVNTAGSVTGSITASATPTSFVPRTARGGGSGAAGRGRGRGRGSRPGLGSLGVRPVGTTTASVETGGMDVDGPTASGAKKTQDNFREMLQRGH